ncbi:hypothetical protein BGL34_05695 [Fructilactobacillus lindneri]|uniref:DUF5640 domain-containing protein n=2 Tax=Fructilactobacillus lindneri TaxID=53444 RepID=A0A0R2K167_9LACO|nr:hypothetical protein [Fructilactobacillus lindneri]ANZ57409.1 hypothetical protein AYR60_00720 [Fructilactobacillus lindneri]ANZ58676.1 hypothetical protein AYR59_00720 [Fructilactobacillus lindneri]KRN80020.1 hypothetical protein IV52_GL000137 [Fructilactobacillus lindneri DSM 20690 = JCM 11027]POG97894.1 hypothetical protein BGL31_05160 [Fructilactobacillus lindneri]POG99226.1 hypothetical protein BGL32_05185 [Fructilactobacillus lindneri]
MKKKVLLTILSASTIALTGVSTATLSQPNVQASTKSFSKEVQGKWNNQAGDTFKIKDSKATLKVKHGNKKGIYKFKVKEKTKNGYQLKADGKKLDKSNEYSLTTSQSGLMQFNYGKQTIQFDNGSMRVKETSKSTSTN